MYTKHVYACAAPTVQRQASVTTVSWSSTRQSFVSAVTYGSAASFSDDGFVEFNAPLSGYMQQEIGLTVRTTDDNGVLYWHGQRPTESGDGQDYVSLGLVNGYLQFRYVALGLVNGYLQFRFV